MDANQIDTVRRTCQVCGRDFKARRQWRPASVCSPKCRERRRAQVPLVVRTCRTCGEEFAATITSKQRLCNPACRRVFLPTVEEIQEAAAKIKAAGLERMRRSSYSGGPSAGYGIPRVRTSGRQGRLGHALLTTE